jgi:hypothetical protein
MAETIAKPIVTGLISMAHAADLQPSVNFNKLLGTEVRGSLRNLQVDCNGSSGQANKLI